MIESPTAHAPGAEVTATPRRILVVGDGSGLAVRCQVVPFQCRMRVLPELARPTAQALAADVAATAARIDARLVGTGTRLQPVPFHRRIRTLPRPARPPAPALPAEGAAARRSS